MRTHPRLFSFGPWALLALAGLCLLPFLRLAFFAHPYLDDFIFPRLIRQHGVWAHVSTTYLTHSGRFSSSLVTALHPLTWGGLAVVQPFVFGFILAFAGSVLLAGKALLGGPRVPLLVQLAGGSLVLALSLLLLPSPTEGFYWVVGALPYLGGVICGLLLLAIMAWLQVECRPAVRGTLWTGAGLLAFLLPGLSEMFACLVLALVVLLAPQLVRRQIGWLPMLLLAVAVVASAVATLAPGNFIRHGGTAHFPLVRGLAETLISWIYSLVSWLSSGLILLLTLLVLPTLQRLVRLPGLPLVRLTRVAWLWPLWTLLGLFLCYAFCHLIVGGPPPSRARNALYIFFVVGWLMSVASGLAYRGRRGWRALPALPTYGRVVMLGLVGLLILSDHNFRLWRNQVARPTNSVTQAYRDWLSGDAARYDREEEARYALIRQTAADSVAVPPLSVQPVTLVWWDISQNPALWGNRVYAAYFHKRAIWVEPQ